MQFVARATSRLVTRVDAARGIWERSFLPTLVVSIHCIQYKKLTDVSHNISLIRFCKFSTAADFEKAVSALNSVEDVDNDVKLQLYGLYKQVIFARTFYGLTYGLGNSRKYNWRCT